ncbi:hypothetical protein NC653_033405 [Populus alba x Populus x berolinensis]|uniref:Uncharacterized protein n=1 Tax=Populus alba x Populus x berolinensis TaxID=444605 RepID=A0AAD6LTW8_9ROSI|nr:hypothetical protein NC653_033405 [Populus alba x Populus x berolinensis]
MHNQTIHDTGVISQFEMINLAEIDHQEADTLVVPLDQPPDAIALLTSLTMASCMIHDPRFLQREN